MALVDVLREALRETRAVRCVIDSVITLYITKPAAARGIALQLKKVRSGMGVTSILISQVSVTRRGFGEPGVEHAADGIVRLDLDEIDGELKRNIIVWKMRGTAYSMSRHPIEITDDGIVVHSTKKFAAPRRAVVEEVRAEGEEDV
jgi:KaiC/GvpD/RAD55 family RecA-like ATPase